MIDFIKMYRSFLDILGLVNKKERKCKVCGSLVKQSIVLHYECRKSFYNKSESAQQRLIRKYSKYHGMCPVCRQPITPKILYEGTLCTKCKSFTY